MASSSYTAEQALTGYLYQIRLALLYSLKFLQKRVHDDAIFYVGIENYDDISFENAQGGLERVIQTKYHAASSGTLTDSSVDLWRSIRIWISIFQEKKEAPPLFYLLTTAKLLKNSATALLADEERAQANKIRSQDKEEKILAMLEKAANNSRNKETQDARTLFLNMPPDDRKKLFSRVVICPSSPSGADLDSMLEEQLYCACGRRELPKFRKALEGWWLQQVTALLSSGEQARIPSALLEEKMGGLRDVFGLESLRYEEHMPAPEKEKDFINSLFVRQLSIIGVKRERSLKAVHDYYCASINRSEWVRESSIDNEELEKFDSRLVDTWQRVFYEKEEECSEDASEEVLRKTGKDIYNTVSNKDVPELRKVKEISLMMGSYHMLADKLEVGWHPRYKQRLQPAEKKEDKP